MAGRADWLTGLCFDTTLAGRVGGTRIPSSPLAWMVRRLKAAGKKVQFTRRRRILGRRTPVALSNRGSNDGSSTGRQHDEQNQARKRQPHRPGQSAARTITPYDWVQPRTGRAGVYLDGPGRNSAKPEYGRAHHYRLKGLGRLTRAVPWRKRLERITVASLALGLA